MRFFSLLYLYFFQSLQMLKKILMYAPMAIKKPLKYIFLLL